MLASLIFGGEAVNQIPPQESIAIIEEVEIEEQEPIKIELPQSIQKIEYDFNVYTKENVNLRFEPTMDSNIFFTAAAGTKLYKVGSKGDWFKINFNDNYYYVAKEYVTRMVPTNVAPELDEQIELARIAAQDLRYLSALVYAESGNQCYPGQQAVAIVVVERTKSGIYKSDIKESIYEPLQFTPVTNGSLDRALALYDAGQLSQSCIDAAIYALQGNTLVIYEGVTYDFTGFYAFGTKTANPRVIIQDHRFK